MTFLFISTTYRSVFFIVHWHIYPAFTWEKIYKIVRRRFLQFSTQEHPQASHIISYFASYIVIVLSLLQKTRLCCLKVFTFHFKNCLSKVCIKKCSTQKYKRIPIKSNGSGCKNCNTLPRRVNVEGRHFSKRSSLPRSKRLHSYFLSSHARPCSSVKCETF